MQIKDYTYYVPSKRAVFGVHKHNQSAIILLVGTYLRFMDERKMSTPGRYDGCSMYTKSDGSKHLRISLGRNDKEKGIVGDVIGGKFIPGGEE